MNEQKNNGRGIFYGVIGIATLVVAIVGATFAYFTATAANNIITGNMAKVELSLGVTRVNITDQAGLIPMSNGMVEAAASSENGVCVDDNGNAVCQIYQITITNSSSAGQFVDGYVALKGGSGEPTDYTHTKTKYPIDGLSGSGRFVGTTMRWAQVFQFKRMRVTEATKQYDENGDRVCSAEEKSKGCVEAEEVYYSTAGNSTLGNATVPIKQIGNPASGANTVNIRTDYNNMLIINNDTNGDGVCGDNPETDDTEPAEDGCTVVQAGTNAGVLTTATILGNSYPVIGTNYIRVSDHTWQTEATKPESYKRENDITSALVFNDNVAAGADDNYYIVVWLSENGKNQTAGATVGSDTNPAASGFFAGNVTFISAQGSEVSATFTDYYRVESDTMRQQQNNG